jgi:hypothetical protein
MDNKEIILKIYKAILNGEVEIENLNILFTDGIVLHITGKENTDFKEYIDNLSKKQLDKLNEFLADLPKIIYKDKITCKCGNDINIYMEGLESFFGI